MMQLDEDRQGQANQCARNKSSDSFQQELGTSLLSREARNLDLYVKLDFAKLATSSNSFEA